MWQSRIHKVREFESSRPVLNESQLKIISLKNNNKDIKTNNKLFIKMSYARYSPLDYGQNQDKDRIHNYGKQTLHFALKIPSYLFICFIASMRILVPLFSLIASFFFLAVKNSPQGRNRKAREYYYKTKSISHYRSDNY